MSSTSRRIIEVCCTLLASGAVSAADYCSNRELRHRDTVTIELKTGVREKPAYYLRDPTHGLILFFRPEDVVALLEERVAKQRSDTPAMPRSDLEDLLEWIRRDLPLKEDTDLFKYGLRDLEVASRLDPLVTELLDAGQAAVDFWPVHIAGTESSRLNDQFDPTTIKRVYWKMRGGDGRKYCSADGFGIFSIVDTIYD